MFNADVKEKSIKALKKSVESYNESVNRVKAESEKLFEWRTYASKGVIVNVENYVNGLANTPKEFDKEFSEIRAIFKEFNHYVKDLEADASRAHYTAGSTSGAGMLMGAGVAALGPTAALAVATTFGTASTGAAIAALSGAAASNAALAWLGGGALVAGGGGMVAGEALLALAGPVGWGIAAVAMAGGALWLRGKNEKLAVEAAQKRKEMEGYYRERTAMALSIKKLTLLTQKQTNGIEKLLEGLESRRVADYKKLSAKDKDQLLALINHTRSLGELLKKVPVGAV